LRSIKINELKNSRNLSCAIRFLEQNGSINLYLYEAIAGGKRSNENYLIREAGTDVGLVHTKNGEYFHLFFLPEVREEVAVGFRTFLSLRYPGASVFFGEKQGIERFLRSARMGVRKTREYNYMELEFRESGQSLLSEGVSSGVRSLQSFSRRNRLLLQG